MAATDGAVPSPARHRAFAAALFAAVGTAAVLHALDGVAARTVWTSALCVGAIVLLATQALPEHITSIGFMALAAAFGLAKPEVVFSGFHASVVWLLFSGIVMGLALAHTGLAARVAAVLLARGSLTFTQAVVAVLGVSLGLAFVMPATVARIVILMPIALALADHLGYRAGSRGRTGLALTVAFGAYMPTYGILPANLPNVVIVGAGEALYGVSISYGEYLLWHFPVIGVLKSAMIVAMILHWYRDTPTGTPAESSVPGPMTAEQKRLAVVVVATVGLWMTDFAHRISPGWIALAAAAIILMPGTKLVPPTPFAGKLNLSPMFYTAGVLGMGGVLADSGAGTLLAEALLRWIGIAPGDAPRNFAAVVGLSSLVGQATTSPAATAILVPLAQELAGASGLTLRAVLMSQLFGLSIVWLPYVAPPLVVGLSLGKVPAAEGIRFCLVTAIITTLVLAPLDFLFWRFLGLI